MILSLSLSLSLSLPPCTGDNGGWEKQDPDVEKVLLHTDVWFDMSWGDPQSGGLQGSPGG